MDNPQVEVKFEKNAAYKNVNTSVFDKNVITTLTPSNQSSIMSSIQSTCQVS